MKNDIYSSNKKFICSLIVVLLGLIGCYFYEYKKVYNSIEVTVNKTATVEYGSKNYDVKSLVDKVNGEIISVKKDIDSKKIGSQEIIILVEKDDVIKEVPLKVEVKDTVAPEIKIKEENISLKVGDTFDFFSNLESVSDTIDGEISYQQKEIVNEGIDTNYYTIDGTVDTNNSGMYPVVIKAVDKYGNISTTTYNVVVKSNVTYNNISYVNYQNDYVSVADTNGLVQLAYSLIGSPYVAGGNSPYGFDCSGFVQYLYSSKGIAISRSSSTQMYDGVAVSYESIQPGDIISWGYGYGKATHSALYVGDGKMIHATNPRQGVILSDVESWANGSGTKIIAVRRI